MFFGIILGFAAGVFVGYKYPRQVEQSVESGKKLFNDLKSKITKEPPPQGPAN
jgi:hypothetical protein